MDVYLEKLSEVSEGSGVTYTTTVTNDDQVTKFNLNNYTTKYLNSANEPTGDENGAIISRDVELVDKTVSVYWDDESNRDDSRPETVDIKTDRLSVECKNLSLGNC